MFKACVAITGLVISSASVNASIIDLNIITRDTSTGLDWLDLTETNGRSYNDISSKFGAGEEFQGWRYASSAEVIDLWSKVGFFSTVTISDNETTYPNYYNNLVNAVTLLGNTFVEEDPGRWDYGAVGVTSNRVKDPGLCFGCGWYHERVGAYHSIKHESTANLLKPDGAWIGDGSRYLNIGHYLVKPAAVPIPSAVWLFGSGLIGLIGVAKRKKD